MTYKFVTWVFEYKKCNIYPLNRLVNKVLWKLPDKLKNTHLYPCKIVTWFAQSLFLCHACKALIKYLKSLFLLFLSNKGAKSYLGLDLRRWIAQWEIVMITVLVLRRILKCFILIKRTLFEARCFKEFKIPFPKKRGPLNYF